MALGDTAIFLIFLATLTTAIGLLFALRRLVPDCREKKRKANVSQTTKVDGVDAKKRKFDLETGSSTEHEEKAFTTWKERVMKVEGKIKKAKKVAGRPAINDDQTTVHDQQSCGNGSRRRQDSKHQDTFPKHIDDARGDLPAEDAVFSVNAIEDSTRHTAGDRREEVVFPKQSDVEFEDIPLEFPRRDDMLDEW